MMIQVRLIFLIPKSLVILHRQPTDDHRFVEKLIAEYLDIDRCFKFQLVQWIITSISCAEEPEHPTAWAIHVAGFC